MLVLSLVHPILPCTRPLPYGIERKKGRIKDVHTITCTIEQPVKVSRSTTQKNRRREMKTIKRLGRRDNSDYPSTLLLSVFILSSMAETKNTPTHVAILPTPGMGHLIPIAELAKRLVTSQSISVTFITLTTEASPTQAVFMEKLCKFDQKKINSVNLPPEPMHDVPSDTRIETRISIIFKKSLPSLRQLLTTLMSTAPVSAFITDMFGTDAFDIASEFSLPSYIFIPMTATLLSLILYLPTLDAEISGEYRELKEPVRIPGCSPIPVKDLMDPMQDRENEAYSWAVHHAMRFRLAKGFMLNSFEDLEPETIKALRSREALKPAGIPAIPVFPIGPLIAQESAGFTSDCLRWLDEQPPDSVLFVSFGSGGTLSYEQFVELAWGLEMSEHRFLWVARSPQVIANASFFTSMSSKNPLDFLPQGFVSRTEHFGFVVPSWAPQVQILEHSATGGFLTHCGWNSTLESIVNGVPLIAWPLYAEQKMNALMLVGEMKIALRPKVGENGVVGRDEIARVVKRLMEGEEGRRARERIRKLRDSGSRALAEGGSSYESLSQVAHEWRQTSKAAL